MCWPSSCKLHWIARILIEQAKGMLGEHFTIPMDNAFQMIRKYAREHNRKVADVAAAIVSGKITSQALITPHGQQPRRVSTAARPGARMAAKAQGSWPG